MDLGHTGVESFCNSMHPGTTDISDALPGLDLDALN